jgi:ABC-type polysaccharide/polyol phosphate export permease
MGKRNGPAASRNLIGLRKRSINEQVRRNRLGSVLVTILMVLLLSAVGAAFAVPFRSSSWWIGAAIGLFVALTVGIVGWWRGTKMILESAKAQPAERESHRQFQNTVEERRPPRA